MFDYKQRSTTREYRDNWERLFGSPALSSATNPTTRPAVSVNAGPDTSVSVPAGPASAFLCHNTAAYCPDFPAAACADDSCPLKAVRQ